MSEEDEENVDEEYPGTEPTWPTWPAEPIPDMTAEQLAATIARLRAVGTRDEALLRALQTELTFRQVGIRKERGAGTPDISSP